MSRKPYSLTLFLSVALFCSAIVTVFYTIDNLKQHKMEQIDRLLAERAAEVGERVKTLKFNMELLANNPSFSTLASDENLHSSLAGYFALLKDRPELLAVFLMNSKGRCIFSTDPRFIGKNYAFRPYFKQAVQHGEGTYVAKGVTSNQLGLYLSRKVELRNSKKHPGFMVMVFKVAPEVLLAVPPFMSEGGLQVFLATPGGVLFQPGSAGFFTLSTMASGWFKKIHEMRQFEDVRIKSLGFPEGTWKRLISKKRLTTCANGDCFHLFAKELAPNGLYTLLALPDSFESREYSALKQALFIMTALFLLAVIPLCYLLFYSNRQSQELERSRSKLRLLDTAVEQAAQTIVITDRAGRIVYVNPAFSRTTGYSRAEALGKTPAVLKSGHHGREFYAELWQTIRSGKVWRGRFRNRRKDGSLYWEDAIISPVFNDNGKITHYIAVKNEITELVRLEHQLKKKISQLQAIMDHAGVGILLVRNRRMLAVNKMLADILGRPQEELVGKETRFFYHSEEEYEMIMKRWYPKLVKGETVSFEHKAILPGDIVRDFLVAGKVSRPGDLETMETVWVLHDITQIKRLQKELEEARDSAEAASRAKSEFLANMSHEIRTPLNGVIGNLNLLTSTDLEDEQKGYVSQASTSAEILMAILNDILDFSKIEAGRLELEETDFNIMVLMEAVISSMRTLAAQKDLELRVNIDERLPECLRGDSTRLRQILMNLMSNAVKFTGNGWIEMTVQVREEDAEGVELHFSIRDTGIGISREKIDQLFQKFCQVDASITRKFGGTGLGLAISKKLVEMMGGSIGAESEPGKGSRFWFTVRFCRGRSSSDGCRKNADSIFQNRDLLEKIRAKACKKRILVVDDNQVNQQVIVAMLRTLGFQTEAVSNGEEAVETLSVIPYDLVFMDIQMPVMDGMEATRRIRAPGSPVINPRIPVVALTAHAFREEIKQFFGAGMNDHMAKPIVPENLIACLKKWLKCKDEEGLKAEECSTDVTNYDSVSEAAENQDEDFPIFDEEALNARTMNDPAVRGLVIDTFCETIPENLEVLKRAIDAGDMPGIKQNAHAIKGSSANIAGMRLSNVAAEIEKLAGETGNLKTIEKIFVRLEEEFLLLKAKFHELSEKVE